MCKKITVAKSKEVKTGSNVAETFKEAYDTKRAVLPMIKPMLNKHAFMD
jgi:hypothetical protein